MSARKATAYDQLTPRERQIMDVLYAAGSATAREIGAQMPDAPTDATVRTLLRVLLSKGHVRHRQEGKAFIYEPARPAGTAARTALRRLVDVFFGGSAERAVSSLLEHSGRPPTEEELARMEELIRAARKKREGRAGN